MRLRLAATAAIVASCSAGNSGSVTLAPTIVIPQDLLQGVTKLTVSVYDPGGTTLSCNALDGTVTGLTNQTPLASKDLSSSNCPSGAKFCGDVSVDKTGDTRLFTAQAFIGSAIQASGCTAASPSQDTLQVKITMLRTLTQSQCNGQPSTIITQCDTGAIGDPVCDQKCQSIEEYFSPGDSSTTSDTRAKIRPMFAWPPASGDAGRLIGVWGEKSASGNIVSMRVLDDSMKPYSGQSQCIHDSSFRLPNASGSPCPSQLGPTPQFNPAIASISGNYFVAFEDGGPVEIHIRSFDPVLSPLQGSPIRVSDVSGTAQASPSMAASGNNLFVAWENQGSIVGKTVSASLAPGAQKTFGAGTGVTVAATTSGWVAVYLNGTDVEMVTIDGSGTASAPSKVNTQPGASHPGVAAFGSNVAVVWADGGGNILVQRFNGTTPIAGDQSTAIQDASITGNQSSPSIAAGSTFFVATWIDKNTNHVRARFLDGQGGFLFNFVTGQSGDFKASTLDGETRNNPIAVVGGKTPFVAIAWEDNTGAPTTFKGIWGRRFPLPQ